MQMHSDLLALIAVQALWEVSTKDRPIGIFAGQPSADAKEENVSLTRNDRI